MNIDKFMAITATYVERERLLVRAYDDESVPLAEVAILEARRNDAHDRFLEAFEELTS